jgi:DNA modification methylase
MAKGSKGNRKPVLVTPTGRKTPKIEPPAVRMAKLGELRPDPRNANEGTERGRGMLEQSLRKYGAGRSIVVDKHGVIIGGNKTHEVAVDIGLDDAIVVSTDGSRLVVVQRTDLDLEHDKRAIELGLSDNRVGEASLAWNADVLQQLAGSGVDISDLWSEKELSALFSKDVKQGRTDPDDCPPERATSITHGDLFELGTHRLLCGDSTKAEDVARLMDGHVAELCFTSPPYNLGGSVGLRNGAFKGADTAYAGSSSDCDAVDWAALMDGFTTQALNVSRYVAVNVQILAGNKRALAAWLGGLADRLVDVFVWVKGNPPPAMAERVATSAFEFVVVLSNEDMPSRAIASASFGRGTFSNVYQSAVGSNSHTKGQHGATFPVEFAAHYVTNLSGGNGVIFEPFTGSGTTMIACEQHGRQCRGIEIEPSYTQMAIDRWEAFTGLKAQKVGEAVPA